jgi:hypothetical protein
LVTLQMRWRLHLAVPPRRVYGFLATDAGRARWWVLHSEEHDGLVHVRLEDGSELIAPVLARRPFERYALRWLGGSELHFALRDDGRGGTELEFAAHDVAATAWHPQREAWGLRLLRLKAACVHGVDLRNHDPARDADAGYADA